MAKQPKSELLELYQKFKQPAPTFNSTHVKSDGGLGFVCELCCGPLSASDCIIEGNIFTGTARAKKAAELEAAKKALDNIKNHPAFETLQQVGVASAWESIRSISTVQVLRKDPILEGHVLLAAQHLGCKLPLAAIIHSKPIKTFIKSTRPEAANHPAAAAAALIDQLAREGPDPRESVPDLLGVNFLVQHPEAEKRSAVPVTSEGSTVTAVLVPPSTTEPVKEVEIAAEGHYLTAIATALGCQVGQVLDWQVVGVKAPMVQLPSSEASSDSLAAGMDATAGHQNAASGEEASSESTQGHPGLEYLVTPHLPSLYSIYEAAQDGRDINERASWLAGQPVKGPALFSLTRCTPGKGVRCAVKWRSFTLPEFWRAVAALFPAAHYVKTVALVAQVPKVYRNHITWIGPDPVQLLNLYCSQHAWRCSVEYRYSNSEAAGSTAVECTAEVASFALVPQGSTVLANGRGLARESAQQRAALAALQQLQVFDAQYLLAGSEGLQPRECSSPCARTAEESPCPSTDIEVLEPGDNSRMQPKEASVVKIEYQVAALLPGSDHGASPSPVIDGRASLGFMVGGGGILPPIEAAVGLLHPGGCAVCRGEMCLEGADPLGISRRLPVSITVKLLQVVTRSGREGRGGAPHAPLFKPPLAQLRYQFIEGIVEDVKAEALVDLGCGDGKLLEHLWRSCPSGALKRMVGVDISANGIARAKKRLAKLAATGKGGGDKAGSETESIGGGDGGMEDLEDLEMEGGEAGEEEDWDLEPDAMMVEVGAPKVEGRREQNGEGGAVASGADRREAATGEMGVLVGAGMNLAAGGAAVGEQACVEGGASREEEPIAAAPEGEDTPEQGVEVTVLEGSGFQERLTSGEAWGSLRRCDLAVMVEVIEHLDPEPLALVGPCVLGGLQPRVFIVTTPNWEYNVLLRAVTKGEGWPGPPGRDGLPLRCSDHRFEWDRREFREWAEGEATKYGYTVRFEETGSAVGEQEVLCSSSWSGPADVGLATQAAVFTLDPSSHPPNKAFPTTSSDSVDCMLSCSVPYHGASTSSSTENNYRLGTRVDWVGAGS